MVSSPISTSVLVSILLVSINTAWADGWSDVLKLNLSPHLTTATSSANIDQEAVPSISGEDASVDTETIIAALSRQGNDAVQVNYNGKLAFIFGLSAEIDGKDTTSRSMAGQRLLSETFLTPSSHAANLGKACTDGKTKIEWAPKEEQQRGKGYRVINYDQVIDNIPVLGATAQIEFNSVNVVESLVASPLTCRSLKLVEASNQTRGITSTEARDIATQHLRAMLTATGGNWTPPTSNKSQLFYEIKKTNARKVWIVHLIATAINDKTFERKWNYSIDAITREVLWYGEILPSGGAPSTTTASGTGKGPDGNALSFSNSCDQNFCYLINVDSFKVNGEQKAVKIKVHKDVGGNLEFFRTNLENDFTKPEEREAVQAYVWLTKFVSILANHGICSFDFACGEIHAIVTKNNDKRGAFYDPANKRFVFTQVPGADEHSANDPVLIAHELAHAMLRARPLDAHPVLLSKCRKTPGEQFGAMEESLADTIGMLLATQAMGGKTAMKNAQRLYKIGEKSLGPFYRDMGNPHKASASFCSGKHATNPGVCLASLGNQFHQPNHIKEQIALPCDGSDELICYVNSGIPNYAAYQIMEMKPNDRGPFVDDDEWLNWLLEQYLQILSKVECAADNCWEFEDLADLVKGQLHSKSHVRKIKVGVANAWCRVGVGRCLEGTN